MIDSIDLDSFSHGQVKSKLWLCEHLEPHINDQSRVLILGSWYNVLGFMMMVRNPKKYHHVRGLDIDAKSVQLANKICDYWTIEGQQSSIPGDANSEKYADTEVVINCSSEHMIDDGWFSNIPDGTLVCIQSSDVTEAGEPWFIKTPSPDLESFVQKYPLREIKFSGVLPIRYDHWGYNRFMLIGIK